MAATLFLRKRKAPASTLSIPAALIKGILQDKTNARQRLFDFFAAVEDIPNEIHDKEWLELLAEFVPEGGNPVKDQAPWSMLALRISRLDPEREANFTLKTAEIELIKKRLQADNFKHGRQGNICWIGFYVDLCRAMKFRPTSEDELWEDDELDEGNVMPRGLDVPVEVGVN